MDLDAYAGPIDRSVLYLQDYHRSREIWEAGNETTLHSRRADSGYWTHFGKPHIRVLKLLHRMGFYGVHRSETLELDHHLITALVERWRQETHTFHLRCGEATITLQDVAIIWGLPIDGKPVTGIDTSRTKEEWQDICWELLGFRPSIDSFKHSSLHIVQIRQHFLKRIITDESTDEEIAQYARALVLMLLGGTLVPDTSGNNVKLMYLTLLRDIDAVGTYSWGSAVLAFLYRELCMASKIGKQQIGGPLQLLQLWAWIRFRCLTPFRQKCIVDTNPVYINDHEELPPPPLAAWWKCKMNFCRTSSHSLRLYRDMLDRLAVNEFNWEPYDYRHQSMGEISMWGFSDMCRARCPLIFFEVVEMHRPDRVMRQFGMRQHIPKDANTRPDLHIINRRGQNGCDWALYHAQHVNEWISHHQFIEEGEMAFGSIPDQSYITWFKRVTRKIISKPNQDINIEPSGYRAGDYSQLELIHQKLGEMKLYLDEACKFKDNIEALRASMQRARQDVVTMYNSIIYLSTLQGHSQPQQELDDANVSRSEVRARRNKMSRLASETPRESEDDGETCRTSSQVHTTSKLVSR